MQEPITHVGLDVHRNSISICILKPYVREPWSLKIANQPARVRKLVERLKAEARVSSRASSGRPWPARRRHTERGIRRWTDDGTMREITRDIAGRRDPNGSPTHDFRLRYLPTKHGHAARPRATEATRGYQSDTPSVKISASVLPRVSLPEDVRPPPPTWRWP